MHKLIYRRFWQIAMVNCDGAVFHSAAVATCYFIISYNALK